MTWAASAYRGPQLSAAPLQHHADMAKPQAIEDHFKTIEQTVEALETGELPLEEALVRYEAGLKAVRQARSLLDRFQARIEELRGEPGTEPGAAP